jgi:hypothetical protein
VITYETWRNRGTGLMYEVRVDVFDPRCRPWPPYVLQLDRKYVFYPTKHLWVAGSFTRSDKSGEPVYLVYRVQPGDILYSYYTSGDQGGYLMVFFSGLFRSFHERVVAL